ncbi:hypothetical protein P8452_62032 [Trifolium repens]|nr:hypothetical protein P8452_62032 [Trifolium repens]
MDGSCRENGMEAEMMVKSLSHHVTYHPLNPVYYPFLPFGYCFFLISSPELSSMESVDYTMPKLREVLLH